MDLSALLYQKIPNVINCKFSSVVNHLCPFQIPLTILLYFTLARRSHIKIFLRKEGLEWVGLGNFFSFCTKHNLDLWNMHLTCGQKYKNWLLYIMSFVSLLSPIMWIFRPCKLLRPSMHRNRLTTTWNYVGTTGSVWLAGTSRLKQWATPTFVYILHIVIGQTCALSCSVSKRCVPEFVRALFRSKPRTCDEVPNLLWEISVPWHKNITAYH
jgi:hypothetical protein